MKVKFFGDSWYWAWFYPNSSWKSSLIRNKMKLPAPSGSFPAIESYFNYLGVECCHENCPGDSFYQVVDKVIQSQIDNSVDYNIVFFSNLIRRLPNDFDYTNYEKLMLKWETDLLCLLEKLKSWAESNQQQIILLGGQSTLPERIFNKISPTSNLHLLTECISTTILKDYLKKDVSENFGIFKLSNDFSNLITDKWDHKLINHIYEDQKSWEDNIVYKNYFFPDNFHLNTTGQLFLVDLILSKIEKLEKFTNIKK
jgi:hypothetical protein